MNITMNRDGSRLTVLLDGRLDTLTSPELEDQLEPELEETEKLVLDLEKLEYISSAGLRVILSAAKAMDARDGEMTVKNISSDVMDVFEVTGFIDLLNIE